MSERRNELLLAALSRCGQPATSADVLDVAAGLARAEGWAETDVAAITRNSVAKRMDLLVAQGKVKRSGVGFDGAARRTTPKYEPVDGFDARAPVPPPPNGVVHAIAATPYESMSPRQLVGLLEAQDEMLEAQAEQLECLSRFLADMREVRERGQRRLVEIRRRLADVGLEAG